MEKGALSIDRRGFLAAGAAFAAWRALGAEPRADEGGEADAFRFARRASIALCGVLPFWKDVKAFAQDRSPDRKEKFVDGLLASEDYVDFRTMHLCDELRVKSEFPINLWPNAVYVYYGRIREHVAQDGSWKDFMRALMSGRGSNFGVPEANFLRATAVRSPEGLSETASLTFLGAKTKEFADWFRGVTFADTKEWKEEIVSFPDGARSPAALAERFAADPRFPREAVRRMWFRLFGRDPAAHELSEYAEEFVRCGYRAKPVLRRMALSRAFAAADYAPRRLEAEVLDDAICRLTHTRRDFRSIAPEPFTFLPPWRRTACIEDGSITNAFLLLFGRPARDTGELEERDDTLTAKQRLYLMNSAALYKRLGNVKGSAEDLVHAFLSREITPGERKLFREARLGARNTAWCLVNSEEFLFRS